MKKTFLMLICLCGITGLATGCGDDSGPKDMPKETTPEPDDTTLLDSSFSKDYC
ncbi:hypothetical protein [Gimesia fumaroli]|uniref:Lipoprotein n=1 Tax=Gimesia fumaroli TaxID=2527976 RepID=A0A518IJI7_9PLAN|nr:hypothetical protein [Gimesia fumaroli]QDV53257.1 hypothetical protein Enr17x_53290 [Gimesia fumaroli]